MEENREIVDTAEVENTDNAEKIDTAEEDQHGTADDDGVLDDESFVDEEGVIDLGKYFKRFAMYIAVLLVITFLCVGLVRVYQILGTPDNGQQTGISLLK